MREQIRKSGYCCADGCEGIYPFPSPISLIYLWKVILEFALGIPYAKSEFVTITRYASYFSVDLIKALSLEPIACSYCPRRLLNKERII